MKNEYIKKFDSVENVQTHMGIMHGAVITTNLHKYKFYIEGESPNDGVGDCLLVDSNRDEGIISAIIKDINYEDVDFEKVYGPMIFKDDETYYVTTFTTTRGDLNAILYARYDDDVEHSILIMRDDEVITESHI